MPKKVQRLLTSVDETFYISTISLAEIAIKNSIGKLIFPLETVRSVIEDMRVNMIAFENRDVETFFSLPFFEDHRDPFDRMLIATALSQNIPIITNDKHFKRYKGAQIVWN